MDCTQPCKDYPSCACDPSERRRPPTVTIPAALAVQEGGDHYRKLPIQPAEYVHANMIPYLEGSIIYYVTRWRDKNGIADLKKARHTLDIIIQLEEAKSGPHT